MRESGEVVYLTDLGLSYLFISLILRFPVP